MRLDEVTMSTVSFPQMLLRIGLAFKAMKFSLDLEKRQKTLVYELKLKKPDAFQVSSKLVNQLTALPGVLQVKWD